MYTFKEDTTFVGVSELRTNLDRIIDQSKKHKVLIGRRNKPVAVLIDIDKYNQMEALFEEAQDYALAQKAKQRHRSSKSADYLPLDQFKTKFHIK